MRFEAARLPRHRGPAAWNAILGPQGPAEPLTGTTTADIVIVGAGFAGLSAARRLTQVQPGARVMVLEAGRVAGGAAGRNSGFMIDLPHELTSQDYAGAGDDAAMIALNRRAIAFARDSVAEYGISPDYFDEVGKVNGAVGAAADRHNRTYAAHLDAMGEAFEHLDAHAMRELTGSDHYRSGLFTPGTVMLQPAGYIRGLADGLAGEVSIREDSPVTAIARAGGDWCVETPGGRVTCGRVILATNGHLESFGFKRGRLMHVMLFASMTEVLPDGLPAGLPRWGITPSDPMGTTMRRIDAAQGGNRIVTRTCATLRSGMVPTAGDMRRAARAHRRQFNARFPGLASARMEHVWAGHLCLSRNGVSVMEELEPGLFSACVQNGLGTTRGTLTGIGAAELACGITSQITRHFDRSAVPTRLPPRMLRDVGANAVLRWREFKSRYE